MPGWQMLIVVELHTVNSSLSCNQFALRMRSTYVEEEHLLMMSSTWDVTVSEQNSKAGINLCGLRDQTIELGCMLLSRRLSISQMLSSIASLANFLTSSW